MALLLFVSLFLKTSLSQTNTGSEYEIALDISEQALNNLQSTFEPLIESSVTKATIAPIITNNFNTDIINITAFNYEQLTLDLSSSNDSIFVNLSDVSMTLYTPFNAQQTLLFTTVRCSGKLTATLSHFSFRLQVRVLNENCTLNLSLIEDSIEMTQGTVTLSQEFDTTQCESVWNYVNGISNIEQQIIDKQLASMPTIIAKALNEVFETLVPKASVIKITEGYYIEICWEEVNITNDDRLNIGVNFIYNVSNNSLIDDTNDYYDSNFINQGSDTSVITTAIILIVLGSITFGVCIGWIIGRFCCVRRGRGFDLKKDIQKESQKDVELNEMPDKDYKLMTTNQ